MTITKRSCRPLIIAVSVTVFFAIGLAARVGAAPNAECAALVNRADVYSAGRLSEPYRSALIDSGRAVAADGTVDRATIMNGCASGAFDAIATRTVEGASDGNPRGGNIDN